MTRQEFSDRLVALVQEAIATGVTRTEIVDEFELHADELDEPLDDAALPSLDDVRGILKTHP